MEIESDHVDNTEEEDEVDERQEFLSNTKKAAKKPSCQRSMCKAFFIGVAIVVFIAMMVQIWSDYGEYIQTATFPPKVVSMSSQCPADRTDACMTKNYNSPLCVWSGLRNLSCKLKKPPHHMVDVNADVLDMQWSTRLNITFKADVEKCVHVTVWSI